MALSTVVAPPMTHTTPARRGHLRLIPGGLAEVPVRRTTPAATCSRTQTAAPAQLPQDSWRKAAARWRLARDTRVVACGVRVAATVLFLVTCVTTGWVGGSFVAPEAPQAGSIYTVKPGDTLWSLAALTSYDSPEDGVEAIRQVNDLQTSEVSVGQQLRLPR